VGRIYEKFIIYDVEAIKDVAYKTQKLQLK